MVFGNYRATFFLAGVLVVGTAVAQIDTFDLNDGSARYVERGLRASRTGSGNGSGDFFVGGRDHMFQNWWWFRTNTDSREYALSSQLTGAQTGANSARLVYLEPISDGNGPRSLMFDIEYTLSDLMPESDKPDWGLLQIGFKVKNVGDEDLSVSFFNYLDYDLNSRTTNTARIAGAQNQLQIVREDAGGGRNPATGFYSASGTGLTHWEIDRFSLTRTKLTDADIDDFQDGNSPFGPGDYTGGFEWQFNLEPGAQFVGSIVKQVQVVPEPATMLVLGVGLAALAARRRRK